MNYMSLNHKSHIFRKTALLILFVFVCGCTPLSKKEPERRILTWLESLQLPNGLIESLHGSNFVSLYENSLAVIVFSIHGDFRRAEKILDFFDNAALNEMDQKPGGFAQFRDREGVPPNGRPHRWIGDNAWLLLAINNYHHLAGNQKYKNLANKLQYWIRSLQEPDGSLSGGYGADGNKIWTSTEGMIDSFNAVEGYDEFHKKILKCISKKYWDSRQRIFLAWVEHEQYRYALDLHSWGYCAFQQAPKSLLAQAERYRLTKIAEANNREITGFCFDTDLDTIWLEGTGEMVVAYQSAGMNSPAEFYLSEMEKMIVPSPYPAEAEGIPYSTNPGTHYAQGQLWKGVAINPSIASSAWYLFAKAKYDPMALGRNKNIPKGDIFWQ